MANSPSRPRNPLAIVLGFSAACFVIFLMITGIFYLRAGRSTSGSSVGGSLFKTGNVGVVEVSGVIMDSRKTIRKLQKFEEDPAIKAVVVRLDSPGGAVGPSQEIYEEVRKYKKPIVASMGSVAASGAFYISAGAKKVFANPGTLTGSIGVIMDFVNFSKLYDWAKVKRYAITTGKYKDAGADYKDMTPDERELMQQMLQDVLGQFKQAVATGRHLPIEEVSKIADGRIMSGNQAKSYKLVDELGTLKDAIREAGKMAGIQGEPKAVYPQEKRRWLEMLMDLPSQDEEDSSGYSGSGIFGRIAHALRAELSLPAQLPAGIYVLWNGAR